MQRFAWYAQLAGIFLSIISQTVGARGFVSISIDHTKAEAILRREAERARRKETTQLVDEWFKRVELLGELCPHRRSATVVAALGTALLAKATDHRVDVYSLLDRGETPDSYSARSLADGVWARHRAELGIDLGANGTNPLNNTPFIGKTRIDEITGVRNRKGWEYFLSCMEAAKELDNCQDATEALRGFIIARGRSVISPVPTDPAAGDGLSETQLLDLIQLFVTEDSEGGRRAQAAVAGILDAAFGSERVIVGGINDPDRHSPLDISVSNEDGEYQIAIEVKDKPVHDHHIRSSIEKTVRDHRLHNIAVVAISSKQHARLFDGTIQWAARHGAKLTIFFDWRSLFQATKCFARSDGLVLEGKVFRRILQRSVEIGVSRTGIELLRDAIGGSDPPKDR